MYGENWSLCRYSKNNCGCDIYEMSVNILPTICFNIWQSICNIPSGALEAGSYNASALIYEVLEAF
jgi:hypothetical protein